jgi:hypothetical protein
MLGHATPGRPQDDAAKLLSRCLAFELSSADRQELRRRLIAGGWQGVLDAANARGLLAPLALASDRWQLAAGIPSVRSADGLMTPPKALSEGVARHAQVRASMRERLLELAASLNAAGMEPLLLKGARSLWTGEPAWRSMGDLDILVAGRAGEAQRIAVAAGYAPAPGYENPDDWHHELNLYRDDLPGWLEFHNRAAMHRADLLLPTEGLVRDSLLESRDGVAVRILPMPTDLLYCAVHHHVSHRGDKYGTMSLKGLYEFAAAFASLPGTGMAALATLAGTHPRLVAMLDFWIAAAAERFNLRVPSPFAVDADAAARWRRTEGAELRHGNYAGLRDELAMAMSGHRLARASGGDTWIGRMRLRGAVVSSLLAPSTVRLA